MQLSTLQQAIILDEDEIGIIAGKLFDPTVLSFLLNRLIVVSRQRGIITSVREISAEEKSNFLQQTNTIDLSDQTVFPGFVDTHVHCTCSF